VQEAVVVAIKDADDLARTKAFIVLKEGFKASDRTADELKEFCKQKMAPFKSPRVVAFLNELPKTGQGKIDNRALITQNP
jgi:benzoate-CoA ligase